MGAGDTLTLLIERSCPLPEIQVQLTSSNPTLLPVPAVVSIADGETSVSVEIASGPAGCGDLTITASAVDHLNGQRQFRVYDTPSVSSITPNTYPACQAFTLQLSGQCFYPIPTRNQVLLSGVA